MHNYLIISTSLNPASKSRILARFAHTLLEQKGVSVSFLDLQEMPLPFCDAGASYRDATTQEVAEQIKKADGILVASPVYNYNINAALKNLVELTGAGWEDKVAGFMLTAGGQASYMSIMPFANSLMLDFRTVIIPRFVYTTGHVFDGDKLVDSDIQERITHLTDELIRMTTALRPSS